MRKGKWLTSAELDLVVRALWIAHHCDTNTDEELKEALQFEALWKKLARKPKAYAP
jgi:hypothetical protein